MPASSAKICVIKTKEEKKSRANTGVEQHLKWISERKQKSEAAVQNHAAEGEMMMIQIQMWPCHQSKRFCNEILQNGDFWIISLSACCLTFLLADFYAWSQILLKSLKSIEAFWLIN